MWDTNRLDLSKHRALLAFPTVETCQSLEVHLHYWRLETKRIIINHNIVSNMLNMHHIEFLFTVDVFFDSWPDTVIQHLNDRNAKVIILLTQPVLAGSKVACFSQCQTIRLPFALASLRSLVADSCGVEDRQSSKIDLIEMSMKTLDGLRILVAEDNLVNTQVITAMLKKLHITFTIVGNGVAAVEFYKANYNQIDGVLMDCEMPELDGYAATCEIREYEIATGLHSMPIIALTAHILPELIQKCKDSGMNDVITKPILFNVLVGKLSQWLVTE